MLAQDSDKCGALLFSHLLASQVHANLPRLKYGLMAV